MSQTTTVNQLQGDWTKLREVAGQQLTQTREILNKLRLSRGETPPSEQELEMETLVAQLTITCQQIDAQFVVVHNATNDRDKIAYEQNLDILINKFQGWFAFFKFGSIERTDFFRIWLQAMGVPKGNRDPVVLDNFGALPKHLSACKTWEQALLFPRRVGAIMEIGSGFGLNALRLSRMARLGTVERRANMVALSKILEKAAPSFGKQPPIGFSQCDFQLNSASTIPIDSFDALWFHRESWNQWIHQDGPGLISAVSELARRVHFLLFTTMEEQVPRNDLLSSLYNIQLAGEHTQGTETVRFFIAQRRFVSVAGKLFNCSDMRIHDPSWQGHESLAHGAALLPWNKPSFDLQTKRFLIGKNQVVRTFLKRTPHPKAQRMHHRETEIWPSVSGLIPELPMLLGHSEDDTGYHLLLQLPASSARLPLLPLKQEDRFIILRSAIRVLHALRKQNLHLNFLRLGNFVITGELASLVAAEFISYEEIEDPLDGLLWLLRDLSGDVLYWHDFPIEPFTAQTVGSLAEEYRTLATLAMRCKNIDRFLADPLVQHQFLGPC